MTAIPRIHQHLLVDADDTLWENNVYFEEAFQHFVEFLDHSTLGEQEVRAVLDEIELVNIRVHGYGALNFGRNMRQCYVRLAERQVRTEDLEHIMDLAERIMEKPLELIDGVAGTLEYLSGRHELTLFTKGHPEEQELKVDRSGLGKYFHHTAIVSEKNAASYRRIIEARHLAPARTWMIGNSPRSDIKPALEAGIGAVYVPHEHTWHLERVPVDGEHSRLVVVESFADLREHF